MDVYVDASRLSQNPSVDECCQKLLPLVPLKRSLNKYRKCPRWSWVKSSAVYGPYDLSNLLRDAVKKGTVPVSICGAVNELIRELSTGFVICKKGSALDNASRTAALAHRIDSTSASVVLSYVPGRETVLISCLESLGDDAVCRVLYCNHPDVAAYRENRGYVVATYMRHSKFPSDFNRQSRDLIAQTKRAAAQFLPQYKHGTPGYEQLIREVMLVAMRDGRYSEERLDGYNCRYGNEVGASEGMMTAGVYLDVHDQNVHIYPKEPPT